MTDLSLVPTDDLLTAISARFDTIIFGGFRRTGQRHDDIKIRFDGAPLLAQGLCMDVLRDIQTAAEEAESDPDHEEGL